MNASRLILGTALVLSFGPTLTAKVDGLRPGSLEVVPDGSFEPPGDLIRVRPVNTAREQVATTIEIRPKRVADDATLVPLSNEPVLREERTFDRAERRGADLVVEYARLNLPNGTHHICYEIAVFAQNRLLFTQVSDIHTLEIGGDRELQDARRRPVAEMVFKEETLPATINGRREMVVVQIPQTVHKTVVESTDRRVRISGGYRRVETALEDRSLATQGRQRIVYFTTNRKVKAGVVAPKGPADYDDTSDASLRFGSAEVTIPIDHKRGDDVVEPRWFRGRDKAFQIFAFSSLQDSQFWPLLGGENSQHDLLIFVHGYNTTFQFALFKTVQLAHDIGFRGKILTFAWASKGQLLSFKDDLEESKRGTEAFLRMLTALKEARASAGSLGRIHIIAHSMGSRVVCGAIGSPAAEGRIPKIANLVLCAGEIDLDTYDAAFANISRNCERHSSYFHTRDRALIAAKEFHHEKLAPPNTRYAPVGATPYLRKPPPCTENIECNAVGTSFMDLLHGYYSTCVPVLEDLELLIVKGMTPQERGLIPRSLVDVEFWAIQP
jgi:esterase/lipase superfamily enzyme